MTDCTDTLLNAVTEAIASGEPRYISGGGSKHGWLGRHCTARPLDVSAHCGVIDYQPGELVITARAGTPVAELNALLAQHNQVLPFDPPRAGQGATLGGSLACNVSGPGRPWSGSIRDLVLGVVIINGKAQRLRFGGQVMKNVAGYDVARLQAGALGTLGILSEISLKVLPRPESEQTLRLELNAEDALSQMAYLSARPNPLTGAAWFDGQMYLRLSGAELSVRQRARIIGGECIDSAEAPWAGLRDLSAPFFAGDEPLWRFSVRPTIAPESTFGPLLIDWGGAQRWLRGTQDAVQLQATARAGGGHASLYRGGDRSQELRQPLNSVEQQLHQRLKQCFDPAGIFNPGRLYSWM